MVEHPWMKMDKDKEAYSERSILKDGLQYVKFIVPKEFNLLRLW